MDALSQVAKVAALPLREPSSARPTYWSKPLLYSKCRPVPVGNVWLDYLVIDPGKGFAPARHMAIIDRWVATSQLNPLATGIQYRMMVDEALLAPNLFSLPPGIERNVDRGSFTPWPVQPQKIFIALQNNQRFRLQVKHTSHAPVVAIASVTGWFMPNLSNDNREAFETSGFVQDETVGENL